MHFYQNYTPINYNFQVISITSIKINQFSEPLDFVFPEEANRKSRLGNRHRKIA